MNDQMKYKSNIEKSQYQQISIYIKWDIPWHAFLQSSIVLKLFLFPVRPPKVNSSQFPDFLLKKYLWIAALQIPGSLLSSQKAGRVSSIVWKTIKRYNLICSITKENNHFNETNQCGVV